MSHVLPAQAPRRNSGNFWSRTWAVLVKEFIQLKRDRVSFAMIIMVPLIQLLLFGYAINTNPRHLPTAVLLQENSDLGRSVLAALRNTDYFNVTERPRSEAELDEMLAAGKIRALAVTSPKRNPALPDVPTVAESGYEDFAFVTYYGVLAPAGTPAAVVRQLNEALVKVLARPDVRQAFAGHGLEAASSTPEAFASLIREPASASVSSNSNPPPAPQQYGLSRLRTGSATSPPKRAISARGSSTFPA